MDKILTWIGQFLGLLDRFTGNYILALLIFAVLVEIILLPLSIKQQKNSIKQAKLRPKEMAIQKQYAGRNDTATRQKVAQEIQALYQKENFNQFAGCLPLLLQLPIIMILYYVVINPLHYEMGISANALTALAEFVKATAEQGGLGLTLPANSKSTIELIDVIKENWAAIQSGFASFVDSQAQVGGLLEKLVGSTGASYLEELTVAYNKGLPNLVTLGMNMGAIPTITVPSWLWTIPVLTFVSYFGSMKLTRKLTYQPTTAQTQDMGCSNQVMDVTMPLISVVIAFRVPAALGVYWIFKSLIGTVKQFAMYKIFPLPVFTEEDYKAAERELAGKSPKKKNNNAAGSSGTGNPNVRSLHHIDDEDYLPPVKQDEKRASTRYDREDDEDEPTAAVVAPTEEKKPIIEAASLKEDDRNRDSEQNNSENE